MTPDNRDCRWSIHPASTHPIRAAASFLIIGVLMGALYHYTHELYYCGIGLMILMASLASFYHKTTYWIDENGITRMILGIRRFLPWSSIRSRYISENGIFLSPEKSGSLLDIRGIFVMFDGNREAVIARIEKKLGKIQENSRSGI